MTEKKFSGYIKRGDITCAEVIDDEIIKVEPSAPLHIKHRGNFPEWLKDRSADLDRSYMRNILKHLNLPVLDCETAVKYVHAVSVTDTFWIKPNNSGLTYKDVIFKNDLYHKAALIGDPDLFSKEKIHSPEITNLGSYNKGWKLVGGEWFMYKSGLPLEIWSEIFTFSLANRLGLNAVEYKCIDGFSVCKCFVSDTSCFEPAKAVIGADTSYEKNLDIMRRYNLQKEYFDIIFLDAIVRNGDRHEFNYGFITDADGINLAPNFDNNMAMFWNGIPTILDRKDPLVLDFKEIIKQNEYDIPRLTADDIKFAYDRAFNECAGKINMPAIPFDTVLDFCLNAYRQI